MKLLVNPAALRDLAGGGAPLLLAHAGVEAAAELAMPGLSLWLATSGTDGDARLHRPGEDPASATLPLPAPPAGLLALVAPDAAAAAPLLAALDGGPRLIEARSAAAALPALARVAVSALAAERAAAGELHEAVATLRQEAEDTRVAMLAALQGDGHRIPPPPPVLALEALPSPAGHAAALEEARESLGQVLGTSLEGIAALALHLAEPAPSTGARLRVRLYGAESGRVHGSWVVPGEALAPGWLHLDLPTPIGPVRETACLDLRADARPDGRLALALEDRRAPPDRAAVQGGAPGERALALRLWTAPFGRRFTVAPHWDWEDVEQMFAPPDAPLGAKVQLPAQVWDAALLPQGRVERVALGAEPPRLVAAVGGGERCLLVLPAVPVAGLDLLQAEVFTALGDAALLDAALWLQPAGAAIRSEADLSLSAPGARWSGWRRAGPAGAPLRLSLILPPGTAPTLAAALVLRNLGAEPEDLLRVEWSELTGARLREPLAVAEARPFRRARPTAASLPRLPAGEIPKVAQIRLQELYESEDGGYRHLDILVIGMQAAGFTWPRLRFKLAAGGDDPVLEFRSRPDWAGEQRPSDVVLTPASCYPVYPIVARRGPLPEGGWLVDSASWCFRREPSLDPVRMQMFRQREQVCFGTPERIRAFQSRWMERALAMFADLGLPAATDLANDPFFGRPGRVMANGQRSQRLKFEILVPISDPERPNACGSFNYHVHHFAETHGIRLADGEVAHTGCAGFGLERVALALFRRHGLDAAAWPAPVRAALWPACR